MIIKSFFWMEGLFAALIIFLTLVLSLANFIDQDMR